MIEIFNPSEILTINEVASRLKCSIATIRDWIFHRKIPFYKVNGRVNFLGEDLNEWFLSKAVNQNSQNGKYPLSLKMGKADRKTLDNYNKFVEKLKKKN